MKFVGEEGVDEGGIQKEFFQLLVRELFDPKYGMDCFGDGDGDGDGFLYLGMFVVEEETHVYWFNKDSFESKFEFELIGIV